MNIIATPPAGTDCIVFGFFLIIVGACGLLAIAEERAKERGRLRRMSEEAKKKAQSAN